MAILEKLIILITALVFYFVGKYAHTYKEKEIVESIVNRTNIEPIAGVDVKTPEELDKMGTDKEKVEEIMAKTFEEVG